MNHFAFKNNSANKVGHFATGKRLDLTNAASIAEIDLTWRESWASDTMRMYMINSKIIKIASPKIISQNSKC